MKLLAFTLVVAAAIIGCSSKQTTSQEARKNLEAKFAPQIGTATKTEFVEHFGNAEWCKIEASGGETCRFYRKKGTKWLGDEKRDKKSFEQFEQVIAEFDTNGVLKDFKASAQK